MLSTGIEALDTRLGGLAPERYFIVSGAPGAGKTSVALHFVGAGLEAGERCAVLTQDDPDDLMAQAEYLGYDFRPAAEAGLLAVLQYRLDFAHNYSRFSDPGRVLEELESLLDGDPPARFVIDSAIPFVDGDTADASPALAHLLERLRASTYITLPGDVGQAQYWRIYDRIVAGAAGIFHVERVDGQVRELSIRKLRQTAVSSEGFRFVIRPGLGVVEHSAGPGPREITEEAQRRVVLLQMGAALSDELKAGLEHAYELRVYDAVNSAFADLATGAFGALLVSFDPRDPEPVFDLVRQLRSVGNGAPILFTSVSQELRSSTRARGLRAGGDDFLVDDLTPQEFLERVEVARRRGHRGPGDVGDGESLVLQPMDDDGDPVAIDEAELRRVVSHQVRSASHPFFAIVVLRPPLGAMDETWRVLCDQLRVREGDLVARTEDGRIAMYLHDISRRHVRELMARIREAHLGIDLGEETEVLSYPADREEVESWLTRTAAQEAVR